MIAPNRFVEVMKLPVRQAGVVARQFWGRVEDRPKDEGGEASSDLVRAMISSRTDVDMAAQEIILLAVLEHFPGVGVAAEEDTPTVRRFPANESRSCVVIDPVDGTYNYVRAEGPYGVMVGLAEEGIFTASVVYLPQTDELYWAVRGGGAYVERNGRVKGLGVARDGLCTAYSSPRVEEAARLRLAALGYEIFCPFCFHQIGHVN